MNDKNISFEFDPKIDSKSVLKKMVNSAYQKNKKFFGKEVSGIRVIFIYTRSQMDQLCNQKTQDWMVGFAKDKQHIYIFSPSVFDKVSNHPATDFSYILTHEITHIFCDALLGLFYPKWFYEGLAGYVAGQYKKIKKVGRIHQFSELHDQKSWDKNYNYPQAFIFTEYLIDTLGKEKTLSFLKQLPKKVGRHHYPQDFTKFFNQFFKKDFDQLALEWKNKT